ncbi:excinuclease ABC subunit UvrA [Patescibacteria group bacterium]|nr:excinuclease ABC subunit UvrA [Patescibacteria group bacterium]
MIEVRDKIKIYGAREHNLKNIDIEIPRNKITCLVGVSGSGKSTIASDIVAAEGQRQYLESLSTYAARLIQKAEKPEIDSISGLSSTITIKQKRLRGSPRSTVGTITELYTYLRLLFSRVGSKKFDAGHFSFNNPKGACSSCKGTGIEFEIDLDNLIDYEKTLNEGAVNSSSYQPGGRYLNILKTTGKVRFDISIKNLSEEELNFLLYSPHTKLQNDKQGFVQSYSWEGVVSHLTNRSKDLRGTWENQDKSYRKIKTCSLCDGARLKQEVLESTINGENIGYFSKLPIAGLKKEIQKIEGLIAKPIVEKISEQLQFMVDVGIGYIALNRGVGTLSAGEAQRVKLARELGTDLIETIYILDEPTVGLHARDIHNILAILKRLRDSQNTIIVVEHDAFIIRNSDHVIEIGPGAGRYGGEIVATGSPQQIIDNSESLTGQYLKGEKVTQKISQNRKPKGYLEVNNASLHNLKNISVKIPIGVFTVVAGVSGSGKSTLINDIFVKKYNKQLVFVDQSQIGASPRANSATYIGALDYIRDVFAKENGVSKALFSSNSKGGCPDCKGLGYTKMDMHFMADIKLECETCKGEKYTPEVLGCKYKNKNMFEVLEMTAEEALELFDHEEIKKRLELLTTIGLGYLSLGQTLDTLSGGESQRLKLVSRLHKKGEFYVLDEPTSGLHFADIERLLGLLHGLVDKGNSVLVIEHNLDVIRSADWIIDLGPEGGDKGGEIVAEGTPEDIMNVDGSYTGQYLKNND